MSRYLTPRTVFVIIKLYAGLWVLLYLHSTTPNVNAVAPIVQNLMTNTVLGVRYLLMF